MQNSAHCAREKVEEQARSQLVTCVGPPRAQAPTKILGGADGLKNMTAPPPTHARLSCAEHTAHTCDANINTELCQYPVTQSVQGSAENTGSNKRLRLDFTEHKTTADFLSRYFDECVT